MIILEHIDVIQGRFSLCDLHMEIPRGAYAVLMGSTGSGKTTLLEVICGLRQPDGGQVMLDGRNVTHATPAARDVGYVPQDGALFKTMTVFEQLAFALAIRRETPAAIDARVTELADLLGIDHLLDRSVRDLSGGERQRVALGRALSFHPGILLLDEPLAALDDETRSHIMGLLKTVHAQTGVTVLHVTHNMKEATELGTQVLCIRDGSVQPLNSDAKKDSYI
jgi:molybdate/tungstate transport system ATP-binding protein